MVNSLSSSPKSRALKSNFSDIRSEMIKISFETFVSNINSNEKLMINQRYIVRNNWDPSPMTKSIIRLIN